MTAALVIVSVLALLELLFIVGVCQVVAAEKFRREKAELLLRSAVKQLPAGTFESAIREWLAVLEKGGAP